MKLPISLVHYKYLNVSVNSAFNLHTFFSNKLTQSLKLVIKIPTLNYIITNYGLMAIASVSLNSGIQLRNLTRELLVV